MNMLSSGEDTNKEFELLNRVITLNEDILNLDPNEEDPYKVRTILLRSWRLYEQLSTLTVPANERGRSTLKCRNTPLIEA